MNNEYYKTLDPKLPSYLNEDYFAETGCLDNGHHIVIDDSVPPTINLPWRIPITLKEKVNNELQQMLKMNIITPIEVQTDWENSMIAIEKPNGNLRICIDPRNLNQAITQPYYAIPTTEEILPKMRGAKSFTKLDASKAYWQILIDESSSKLLTFNSPTGRYWLLCMPYEIHSASNVCQQIIENIKGAENNQDNVIVWSENSDKLQQQAIKAFESVHKHGQN